jgi:phytanoyl-CoA hydroxylase
MSQATDLHPAGLVDIRRQTGLTESQVGFFRCYGFLVLQQIVEPEELKVISDEITSVIADASAGRKNEDYYRAPHETTDESVPFRVEYILDKAESCRVLLGHPLLLGAIRGLQGESFIPTWDSLVFKLPGSGCGHAWHRDGAPYWQSSVDLDVAAVDVGVYLDSSDLTDCLWVIPGSNRWPDEHADSKAEELGHGGFETRNGLPVPVKAGDAILHNVRTLHGSAATRHSCRRVLYYEFRQIAAEREFGPHSPDYIPLKQQVLNACIALRQRSKYISAGNPFEYEYFSSCTSSGDRSPQCFRYPHESFWRYHSPFRS